LLNQAELGAVRWLSVVGRLAPGVTLRAATVQATTVLSRIERQFMDSNHGWGTAVLQPLTERVVGDVRPLLEVLATAVGLVLLVICVNLATLSLAREVGRQRELAIRSALGATPARRCSSSLPPSSPPTCPRARLRKSIRSQRSRRPSISEMLASAARHPAAGKAVPPESRPGRRRPTA
jgi:hypothetical protein